MIRGQRLGFAFDSQPIPPDRIRGVLDLSKKRKLMSMAIINSRIGQDLPAPIQI